MAAKTQNHWYTADHCNMDPFRSLFHEASSEKEDLICLNDRLGDVFQKIEKLRCDVGKHDNSAFLLAITCLEEEMKKLKAGYEAELSRMRRETEKLAADKNEAISTYEKCKLALEYLQIKLDDECKENQKRRDEIADLKCRLSQKEKELSDTTSYLQCVKSELELAKPRLDKYQHDSETYRQQFESEKRMRQDTEDGYNQLVEKLNFDSRIHEQQVRDLQERLENTHKIIESLNDKIRELNESAAMNNLPAILQRVRDQMQEEFEKYRRDTEETVNKTLNEMKARLDKRLKEKQYLEEEKDRLNCLVAKLQGQINEVQAQLSAAVTSNQQLQVAFSDEKQRSCDVIRDLEGKMHDIQVSMMDKVREVQAGRNVQTSLRSEIEALKAIVDSEEKRLSIPCLPPVNCGTSGPVYATMGYPNRAVGCRPPETTAVACTPVVGNRTLLNCKPLVGKPPRRKPAPLTAGTRRC